MTALWITLGVLAFLFSLLLIPLRIEFTYCDEPKVLLRYLFFKFQLIPEKERKQRPQKSTKELPEPKEEESILQKLRALLKRKGASGFLQLVKELAELLTGTLKNLLRRTRIKQLDICFTAGADNAADAAMQYGEACAVIYPMVSALCVLSPIQKLGITVDLDYHAEVSTVFAKGQLHLLPVFAIKEAARLLFRGFGILTELRKDG